MKTTFKGCPCLSPPLTKVFYPRFLYKCVLCVHTTYGLKNTIHFRKRFFILFLVSSFYKADFYLETVKREQTNALTSG